MAEIALTPLRYDLEAEERPRRVVAPPYDVIGPEGARAGARTEQRRSPDPPRGGRHKYANAAALLARLRDEKVLMRDEEPAFTGTTNRSSPQERRSAFASGFLGLVRLVPFPTASSCRTRGR